MAGGIGFSEILIILVIFMFLFGAKRLPQIARSLGTSIFEFKRAVNSGSSGTDKEQKNIQDFSQTPR